MFKVPSGRKGEAIAKPSSVSRSAIWKSPLLVLVVRRWRLFSRLWGDGNLHSLAVTHHYKIHRLPDLGCIQGVSVIIDIRYFLAAELDNDIATLQTRLLRWTGAPHSG